MFFIETRFGSDAGWPSASHRAVTVTVTDANTNITERHRASAAQSNKLNAHANTCSQGSSVGRGATNSEVETKANPNPGSCGRGDH